MKPVVTIDCFPESMSRYGPGWAVVAVDVIRATTTATTAVAGGRRCFPVASVDMALTLRSVLSRPLLAGEVGGSMPTGFDENNSPAAVSLRTDVERPLVLLSSSGTRLLADTHARDALYAASLRNVSAQIDHIIGRHDQVAVVGAGTRGEFREEDQLCCAWIAAGLIAAGYEPVRWTASLVERWRDAPLASVSSGASARYLLDSGQRRDLDFVLGHSDDLPSVFAMSGGELMLSSPATVTETVSELPLAVGD